MGKVTIDEETLDEIGQAIIDKGGATAPMKPGEMADKIAEIPSGGDDGLKKYTLKTLESFDAASLLGYDATDPVVQANQQMFTGFSSLKSVYAPMMNIGAGFVQNCTSLLTCTIRTVSNRLDNFSGTSSMTDLTIKANSSAQVVSWTALLSGINTSCTIHCLDKDVKYIDGAWVVVERS